MRSIALTFAAFAALAGSAEARTVNLGDILAQGGGAVRGATINVIAPEPVEAITRGEFRDLALNGCRDLRGSPCYAPRARRTAEGETILAITLEEGFSLSNLSFNQGFIGKREAGQSVIINGVAYRMSDLSGLALTSRTIFINLDALAAQNLELLGGPGSVYGDEYFFDPTPEQLAGGISCVFAQDGVDLSSLLISVAPVSPSNRARIIDDLTAQSLNEATTESGALTYGQQGDESLAPAIYNVVTQESWISVISSPGGPAFYEEAVVLAGEVEAQVYN